MCFFFLFFLPRINDCKWFLTASRVFLINFCLFTLLRLSFSHSLIPDPLCIANSLSIFNKKQAALPCVHFISYAQKLSQQHFRFASILIIVAVLLCVVFVAFKKIVLLCVTLFFFSPCLPACLLSTPLISPLDLYLIARSAFMTFLSPFN